MLTLKCTKIVQDLVGLKPSGLIAEQETSGMFGAWYVNQFGVDRKKAVIFMSKTTLVSFVYVGVKKKADRTKEKFPFIFLDGLFRFLRLEDFSPEEISLVMDDCHSWQYAKTSSKPVLGNMNELVWHYQHVLGPEGEGENLDEIHGQINRIP